MEISQKFVAFIFGFPYIFLTFMLSNYFLVWMLHYLFFAHEKLKKPPLKVAKKYSNWFFSLLPWAAQTAQIEEFMFQNVAYRPTVYKTGVFRHQLMQRNKH